MCNGRSLLIWWSLTCEWPLGAEWGTLAGACLPLPYELPTLPRANLLPDCLTMMETLEAAPDPFFGIMSADPGLPSPLNIPQVRDPGNIGVGVGPVPNTGATRVGAP